MDKIKLGLYTEISKKDKNMERFTITKTHRWGNADTRISHIYSASRRDIKKDDVIRIANQMIEQEKVYTNDVIEYEVLLAYDNGNTEFIHRVEKAGGKSK
tara:strand:- start:700 stop:999 length:300 start_codon:yes stop_codon:yes gene_type:complete